MKKAKWMGWAGVWEEAHTTGKQSRSGGLATLVRAPTTPYRMTVGSKQRWHRVVVPWKKGVAMHVFNVYGWNGYERHAEDDNARMLKELREEIGVLGSVPWFVEVIGTELIRN